MADYSSYYCNQAGNGLPVFHGVRYQRGHGFFGRMFQRFGMPLLKYIGKQALQTGVNIGSDVLEGKTVRDSTRQNLVSTGRTVAKDAVERARKYVQTGEGKKRKRKNRQSGTSRKRRNLRPRKRCVKRRKGSKKKSVRTKKSKRQVHFQDVFSS
jgi:hypothetical protein